MGNDLRFDQRLERLEDQKEIEKSEAMQIVQSYASDKVCQDLSCNLNTFIETVVECAAIGTFSNIKLVYVVKLVHGEKEYVCMIGAEDREIMHFKILAAGEDMIRSSVPVSYKGAVPIKILKDVDKRLKKEISKDKSKFKKVKEMIGKFLKRGEQS